jgi:hypothetical protein
MKQREWLKLSDIAVSSTHPNYVQRIEEKRRFDNTGKTLPMMEQKSRVLRKCFK